MKGYVQVYTGDGKGKTTAAIGLALRACGAGLHIFIGQFVKGQICSEIKAINENLDKITIKQYGRKGFIKSKPEKEDIEMAKKGLLEVSNALKSGKYDVVILDEANIAIYFKLFNVEELLKVIKEKPDDVELVITGRKADPKIIEAADLVTEMKEIKHYYKKGVRARPGIEN
ncbi:MAG: cob(I)yrinic acid a,c-diamide adenosyltransferase [Candidatus Neomarinimicrobiota bacterium]|nr:MAG: cob(I)yrinic acid a,c-diamide adenosyltransferase [Candidatus Neomarinimicrobiota bacterium]